MKKELQKQMDSMMNMTMKAITNNKKLEPALNELFKYAPQDEKYQFILLHEIANQYLHELLDIDSEFHDYSFEEGIKICIEEIADHLKERFQICTIQFQLDDITRTITFPKRLPLADMTYFVMSSLDIVCSYDFMINCEGIDYSTEEMQICSIADLCLEKNDMFLLSFFDSETDEFYPVTGKLINEELNKKEIELERIQVIETQNEGPWVEENERRTLEEQNDQLVSGFFFNKMFYERPDLFEELENGKIDLIIGTQALIQENVKYKKLGLVITDEQHRFGVNQRDTFKGKGISPDVLSMSATPIPRTYALTIYGDTDVSSIKSKPKGRKEIITVFKKEKDITDVLEMMKKELELNHQIYVVAPMIDTESDSEKESVYDLEEKMNKAFGKIAKIGIIHGKIDPKEKNKIMTNFENNKINILISTTVIEVGINVPNASMIVIFSANMFGLSTLHQLRGRVGRGDIQSYCILVAPESQERLRLLEKTNDGFAISEYDFQTRGEGNLFGTEQSGELSFKMANIKKDFKMLLKAKEDAEEFISTLLTFNTNPEYEPIIKELKSTENLD